MALGPNRLDVLDAQRDSLMDLDFSLETQVTGLEANRQLLVHARPAQGQGPPIVALEAQIINIDEKLLLIQDRRVGIAEALVTLRDEIDNARRLKEAMNFSIPIPEDLEIGAMRAHNLAQAARQPNAAGVLPPIEPFAYPLPDMRSLGRYMGGFDKNNINFRSFFHKLFTFGQANEFSHRCYKYVLPALLSGENYEQLMIQIDEPLGKIVESFLATGEASSVDPISCHTEALIFQRKASESIRACMQRYCRLCLRAGMLYQGHAEGDFDKIKMLMQCVGPKTRKSLVTVQLNQINLQSAASKYEDMLLLAEQQEALNGEWSRASQLFTPYLGPEIPYQQNMMGIHAAELAEDSTKQKAKLVNIDKHDRTLSKTKDKRIQEQNRSRQESRTKNFMRSRSMTPEDNDFMEDSPAARITPTQAQFNVPQAQLQALQQPSQPQQRPTPQVQQQQVPVLKPFQQPVLMPNSMDYNNAAREDQRNMNALRAGQSPGQYSYNRGYQGQRDQGYQRSYSPMNRYPGGQYQDQQYQGNQQRGNDQSWSRNQNFQRTPFDGSDPEARQHGPSTSPPRQDGQGGYRPPSPFQRGRDQFRGQSPGRNSRFQSPARYMRVRGVHVPPDYDFNSQFGDHCRKCDVRGHDDYNCVVYHLFNEKGCRICKSLGLNGLHFESYCKHNFHSASSLKSLN